MSAKLEDINQIENVELKNELTRFLTDKSKKTLNINTSNRINNLSQHDIDILFNEFENNKTYGERLRDLYINNVGLTEIPDSIGKLENLITLNLSFNKISKVSTELSKLTKLYVLALSENKITNLPDCFANLRRLGEIYLDHNSTLAELPDSLFNLRNLEKIQLIKTQIKKTDREIIEKLEILSKNTNDNSYNTKKDKEHYKNPKIYIDDIGMERKTLKNVLSKMDFDNIVRGETNIVESPKKSTVKRSSTIKKPRTPTPPNDTKKSRTPSVSPTSSKKNNTKKSRTP
jgi:hypothetical protein